MENISKELADIVGSEYVLDDPETIEKYSHDKSFVPPRNPSAVIKPKTTEEVQKIVKLCLKYKIPITPCSSGIHFYGNTIPNEGGIIVSLERMNKILKIDERNRHAVIEPGVTWGQLQNELDKHGFISLIPLLPHHLKSVVSSTLEREPMCIPKHQYADPGLTMEIIMPNGDLFRTGSSSFYPGNLTAMPYGPGLDFFRFIQGAQGTMGIITWLGVKIEVKPTMQKLFFISCEKFEDAVEPVYRILRKTHGEECLILNNFNLANILTGDWPREFKELRITSPPWTVILCLEGLKRFAKDKIESQEKALLELAKELPFEIAPVLAGFPDIERKLIKLLRNPWPKDKEYWKNRFKGSSHDIFFYTTLNRVQEFIDIMNKTADRNGYPTNEIGVYVQPLERGRVCHCEFNLFCNMDDPQDVERVSRLFNEASEQLISNGAFFTRPYGLWAKMMYSRMESYSRELKKIKKLFDPTNIMNPGRLCF
ncbi:MAG: FAD-binding oxidoreductase [Candidatus Helarchaeota archaeon]|nr:FAD-binding oxidoreductase [Candidatus Helarchaeota archaeon]